ncbi:protein of unknown function [Pustulibacterium marinum]|uniref:DUF2383 domain-containing protein n=1 Tax=Pustulibacterium marinum TaxID=1224947 RepID=A0A1I7EZW0_9FLAO|nr:DUF2383 domain-containing protein [Pustulibacterium marinum]SFU29456.1 protein of unknown function [Pustulibacterium marinum]
MDTNKTVINVLNDLLKLHMETEQNYLECINQIFHRGVRSFFVTQAQTKNKFVHQLALEVQKLGGDIYTADATVVNHFDFYEDLRTISFEEVLNYCLKFEEEMIATYEKAIHTEGIEETTQYLLLKQKTELESLLTEAKIKEYRTHERLVS